MTPPARCTGSAPTDAVRRRAAFRQRGHSDWPTSPSAVARRRLGTVVNMDLLAVWIGKLTLLGLRLLGRRGNALPGLVVEKVFPRYLARAMARLPEGVVV